MQFVISRSDLVHELQTVTGVVEKRATLPILSNLLLQAEGSGLQIGASDLEVTIRAQANATVKQPGAVTLPAAKLHEIARSLPDAEVTFKLMDRHQVAISCGRTKYRISGQPDDDFPDFPKIDESIGVDLPATSLREMIARISFAITTEDPRYSLNGALLMLKDKTLTLVATDGHRLAFASKTLTDIKPLKDEIKVIVPRKALTEVSKMTSDMGEGDMVHFGCAGNHIYFVVGDQQLTSNVLEGNFPRYENVMPKSCSTSLKLDTAELSSAVRRVSLLASDRFGRAIRLSLSSGKLELFSKTEMGEAEEALEVDYDGPETSIGFNAKYLLDFLGVVGSESVLLELNPVREGDKADDPKVEAGDKPGQLRPEPQGEMNYRYVVMPMHL
jgi:DNA polymerase-3 subunit beta